MSRTKAAGEIPAKTDTQKTWMPMQEEAQEIVEQFREILKSYQKLSKTKKGDMWVALKTLECSEKGKKIKALLTGFAELINEDIFSANKPKTISVEIEIELYEGLKKDAKRCFRKPGPQLNQILEAYLSPAKDILDAEYLEEIR